MSAPKNPAAFPSRRTEKAMGGMPYEVWSGGMTLRDWFAGQALVGFTTCNDGEGDVLMGAADTARAAYNYADAMLVARAHAMQEGGSDA